MRSIQAKTLLVFLIALAAAAGCARKPPEPSLARLYESLGENVENVDLSGLAGRRIVIDPGHGGVFPGAVGVKGLKESDVNLGVALYLWGLLAEAGAEVTLTRSTDRDFVEGDSLRLRDDLKARVDIVRQVDPDLFISLHHNAEPGGDSTFNQIQIYHKMGDAGPSLDVARLMARHLLLNLGEPDCRVLPGNYYVLRNSPAPSVLCEPSYLSNPVIENKLKLAEKQRLEAESYFLGLVDYFSRGVPAVASFTAEGGSGDITPRLEAVFDASAAVDPSTVRMTVDGSDVDVSPAAPGRFTGFPPSGLAGGWHTAGVSARGTGGNASRLRSMSFYLPLKPAIVHLSRTPSRSGGPYPQRITAVVEDSNGNPVADSTVVEFIWDGGKTERLTRGGRAAVFVGKDLGFDRTYVAAVCQGVPGDLDLTGKDGAGMISGFVNDDAGRPLAGAVVSEPNSGAASLTDEYGFFAMPAPEGVTGLEVGRRGYRKTYLWVRRGEAPVAALERLYAGLPAATTVTIDPAGGGGETGSIWPAGTRTSDLNLAVAVKLAALLRAAGIDARLTRKDDTRLSPEERVEASEDAGSDMFITIAHRPGSTAALIAGHYHNSPRGVEIADLIDTYYRRLAGSGARAQATANYVVQQTSCPAVSVDFTAPATLEGERGVADIARIWRDAYALFCAVLAYRGAGGVPTFSIGVDVTEGGAPAANAVVVVDGALEVMTDASGHFALELLDAADHTIEAYSTTGRSAPAVFNEESATVNIELETGS